MAYGKPICACCGSRVGIEEHHLWLRSEGCPDDLTVWRCHGCHGRAHGLSRRLDISERTKAALAAAKARGVKLGTPSPRPFTDHLRQLGSDAQHKQANARARQLADVLAQYAELSANAAAKALNDAGIPSARGGKWTARSVINVRTRLERLA